MKIEMNHRTLNLLAVVLLASLCCAACAEEDDSNNDNANEAPQCDADGYVAFDSANHQNQDIRLGVYDQMTALMSAAADDHSLAAANFTQAKELYTDADASAKFQEKVQGRTDDHLADKPLQGDYLDATIVHWLDAGIAATTNLEAAVAKQWVDKTFIHFFFLSVYHEMMAGDRSHWDEAYGYWGSGPTNNESDLQGLAKTAFKRDATNATNIGAEVFNNLIDGSCELETALIDEGLEEVDWTTYPEISLAILTVDEGMLQVLAYSAGHEAFEMQEILDDSFDAGNSAHTDEMWIKMSELAPFFEPLGRLMEAAGGESASRAALIRTYIDTADFSDLSDNSWMTDFQNGEGGKSGAQIIMDALEAEFAIEIKG